MMMKLWTSGKLLVGDFGVGMRWERHTLQLHHSPHGLVDGADSFTSEGTLFALEDGQADGDNEIGPAPEGEVPAEGEDTIAQGFCAEPAVRKVRRVEGEEYGEGKELSGSQADGLRSRGIRKVLGRNQS